MNQKSRFFTLVLFLLTVTNAFDQLGFSHELGVISGPVAFQSDYGERNDWNSKLSNVGYIYYR